MFTILLIYLHNSKPMMLFFPMESRSSLLFRHLTSMLNDFTDDLPVLNIAPDLLRQRVLSVVVFAGQVDVDARALACKDLCVLAVLAEVDCCAVDLVEENGGQRADNLQGEVGALDDVDGRDERVNDDGCARGVVDGDSVCLAIDADGGVLAAGDEDGVVDFGVEFNDVAGVVEVVLSRWLVFEAVVYYER